MNGQEYSIRVAKSSDYGEIETLTREAFWNVYRPGCYEHYLVHTLRHDTAFIPELSLVM